MNDVSRETLPFGDAPRARRTDPDTSWTAIPDNVTEQAARVLQSYAAGAKLLDEEAYAAAGMDGHQRCTDLRRAGYIERAGKRPTSHGKPAYTCVITPRGLKFLARYEQPAEPQKVEQQIDFFAGWNE